MKILIAALALAVAPAAALACPGSGSGEACTHDHGAAAATAPSETTKLAPGEARVTIPVTGMHCDHCISRLKTALKQVDGVKGVDASLDPGQAVIAYDAKKVQPQRLAEAIDATGFKAGKPSQN